MYIEAAPNRNSPPAILLRESYRDNGKVKKRTLLNLSDWPPELVEGFKALRESVVAKAQRSPTARAKLAKRRTADGLPVLSFQSLLAELATLTRNATATPFNDKQEITLYARPTPIRRKVLGWLFPFRLWSPNRGAFPRLTARRLHDQL